jgi:hypothetical protein
VTPKEQTSIRSQVIYLQTGKASIAHLARRNLPSNSIAVKIRSGQADKALQPARLFCGAACQACISARDLQEVIAPPSVGANLDYFDNVTFSKKHGVEHPYLSLRIQYDIYKRGG